MYSFATDESVSPLVPRLLADLQHRGQHAAGLTVLTPDGLHTQKRLGLVRDAIDPNPPPGRAAIGHVRYATSGANLLQFAQPFEQRGRHPWNHFALAFNGHLANFDALREDIKAECDTEIITQRLSQSLAGEKSPNFIGIFQQLSEQLDGAYNIAFLNAAGDMVILRDPLGIRPLCWAKNGSLFAAASESAALANIGMPDIQSLQPGEMILIQHNELRIERFSAINRTAHCFFEWVYFADARSVLDDKSVAGVRAALGRSLADQERLLGRVPIDDGTVVVPIPETARSAAVAMAHELGVPLVAGLIRNPEVGRTFIEDEERDALVRKKFSVHPNHLVGKRVLLIEDSLIRGTTLRSVLAELREKSGASEIHVRIACPPMVAPCYYGIDIATVDELIMAQVGASPELLAEELGADSLAFLPWNAVFQALGMPAERLCRGCLTGSYPTPAGQRLYHLALRERQLPTGGAIAKSGP